MAKTILNPDEINESKAFVWQHTYDISALAKDNSFSFAGMKKNESPWSDMIRANIKINGKLLEHPTIEQIESAFEENKIDPNIRDYIRDYAYQSGFSWRGMDWLRENYLMKTGNNKLYDTPNAAADFIEITSHGDQSVSLRSLVTIDKLQNIPLDASPPEIYSLGQGLLLDTSYKLSKGAPEAMVELVSHTVTVLDAKVDKILPELKSENAIEGKLTSRWQRNLAYALLALIVVPSVIILSPIWLPIAVVAGLSYLAYQGAKKLLSNIEKTPAPEKTLTEAAAKTETNGANYLSKLNHIEFTNKDTPKLIKLAKLLEDKLQIRSRFTQFDSYKSALGGIKDILSSPYLLLDKKEAFKACYADLIEKNDTKMLDIFRGCVSKYASEGVRPELIKAMQEIEEKPRGSNIEKIDKLNVENSHDISKDKNTNTSEPKP